MSCHICSRIVQVWWSSVLNFFGGIAFWLCACRCLNIVGRRLRHDLLSSKCRPGPRPGDPGRNDNSDWGRRHCRLQRLLCRSAIPVLARFQLYL